MLPARRPTFRLALAGLTLMTLAVGVPVQAGQSASPQRSRVNAILTPPSHAVHLAPSVNHTPQNSRTSQHKSDAQIRAEVLAIERDQTGYTPPASKRRTDTATDH